MKSITSALNNDHTGKKCGINTASCSFTLNGVNTKTFVSQLNFVLTALLNSLKIWLAPDSWAPWWRRVDGWKKHGDKQVVDWAQTAGSLLFVNLLLLALWTCAESFRESAALFKQSQILLVLKPPACLCWPKIIRFNFKLSLNTLTHQVV